MAQVAANVYTDYYVTQLSSIYISTTHNNLAKRLCIIDLIIKNKSSPKEIYKFAWSALLEEFLVYFLFNFMSFHLIVDIAQYKLTVLLMHFICDQNLATYAHELRKNSVCQKIQKSVCRKKSTFIILTRIFLFRLNRNIQTHFY